MEVSTSMCTARVVRHLNRRPHLFSVRRPNFTTISPFLPNRMQVYTIGVSEGEDQPSAVLLALTATYNIQGMPFGAS